MNPDFILSQISQSLLSLGKKIFCPSTQLPDPMDLVCTKAQNTRIKVYTADISSVKVDAIVNAANCTLHLRGGALSSALLDKAGQMLQDECTEILRQRNLQAIPVGQAIHTPAFGLVGVRYVIHAVGPSGVEVPDAQAFRLQLQSAIKNAFREAHNLRDVASLAMPLISSGV